MRLFSFFLSGGLLFLPSCEKSLDSSGIVVEEPQLVESKALIVPSDSGGQEVEQRGDLNLNVMLGVTERAEFRKFLNSSVISSSSEIDMLWSHVDNNIHSDYEIVLELAFKMLEFSPTQDVLIEVKERYGDGPEATKLFRQLFTVVATESIEDWSPALDLLSTNEAKKAALNSLLLFIPTAELTKQPIQSFISDLPNELKDRAWSQYSRQVLHKGGLEVFDDLVKEQKIPFKVAKETIKSSVSSFKYSEIEANLSRYQNSGLIDLTNKETVKLLAKSTSNDSERDTFERFRKMLSDNHSEDLVKVAVEQRAKDLIRVSVDEAVTFSSELENPVERDVVIRGIIDYAVKYGENDTAEKWRLELSE